MSIDRSISKAIARKARINLGVNISYQKSWKAKEHIVKILKGDAVESYILIPEFFDKFVKSNPGMISFIYQNYTHLQIDDNKQMLQSI